MDVAEAIKNCNNALFYSGSLLHFRHNPGQMRVELLYGSDDFPVAWVADEAVAPSPATAFGVMLNRLRDRAPHLVPDPPMRHLGQLPPPEEVRRVVDAIKARVAEDARPKSP